MPPDASFMHSWEHDAGVYKVIHDNSTRDSTLVYPSRDGGNRYQRSMDTRAYRCADRANYSSSRQLNPLPPRNGTTVFLCFSHGSRDARNYRETWKGASEISPLKTDAIIKRPSGLSLRSSRAMDLDPSEISITGRGWTKEGLEVVEPGKNEGRVCNELW